MSRAIQDPLPPEYYTDGLIDLGRGAKVPWDRIAYALMELHADADDLKKVYGYMLEDDRFRIEGTTDGGVMLWKAIHAADEASGDLRVFLAKRRLQRPDPENEEEHY